MIEDVEPVTYVYAFDHPHELSLEELKTLIGGKGANLAEMTTGLELPVPPGFTVSTAACRAYLDSGWPDGLDDEIHRHIALLEEKLGRGFGDPANPLLVSVRSGAAISMPGMMDTILNLGLNDETTAGLAAVAGGAEFAEACRDRLETGYREIVRTDEVPADPWLQLRGAIEAVFRSWNGDRACSYRRREGIPDDMGTGVTVQAMVFGNLGPDSATGVVFTRDPATGENVLYGDVLFDAQGEDVVAGTHHTEPIAVLGERLPEIAEEFASYADKLERHHADVCDIEFTIERGRLWILQNRIGKRSPQAAVRIAVEMAEDPDFPLSRAEAVERVAAHLADPPRMSLERDPGARVLATGLAASPGLASGGIATSADAAADMAAAGKPVLLVRPETSPDDVHGMAAAVGILTSTGGLASHAAVVARGWGIPAVVGAAAVTVDGGSVTIGEETFGPGSVLTIDGGTGEICEGALAGEAEVVPEAVTLLGWAEELGIAMGAEEEASEMTSDGTSEGSGPSAEAIIHLMSIKGFAMVDAVAEALMADPEETSAALQALEAEGLAEATGPMWKLTNAGKELASERLAAEREAWGKGAAEAALDGLLAHDHRLKEIVTAWQMREVDGAPVLNDHSDAEYDAGVLADFAALAEEADAFMKSVAEGMSRMGAYVDRLARAARLVTEGNHDYIASPRFDSYHNIWFELHEDMILLAGRTREEEVAAGRA